MAMAREVAMAVATGVAGEMAMAAKVVCLKAAGTALAMEEEKRGWEKVEMEVRAAKVVVAGEASKGREALPLPSCPMNGTVMR